MLRDSSSASPSRLEPRGRCCLRSEIRSAITDSCYRFKSKIKRFCSCDTVGSGGIRPYGLERNAGECCRAVNREVEGGDCILEVDERRFRAVHQVGELRGKESKLICERDEARESAKKSLEKVSQMESKQLVRNSQAARSRTVKPEKFSGSGNDTDFQAFLDQFEVCAKVIN